MPPICGKSASKTSRSIAKSSPVGLSAPWVTHATIRMAATVCGSAERDYKIAEERLGMISLRLLHGGVRQIHTGA